MRERRELWLSGEGGYHTYRIPALSVTTTGTLLAFCEGRKHSRADAGEIDTLLVRAADAGVLRPGVAGGSSRLGQQSSRAEPGREPCTTK
jgi:hypothetical protein